MARNNNQVEFPQAKEALNRMKFEVANQLGINLTQGYNGNISTFDAGRIGGNMVKQMIQAAEQSLVNQTVTTVRTGFQQALNTQESVGTSQTISPSQTM